MSNHLSIDKKTEYRRKNEIKYCSLVQFGNTINQILDDCHFIIDEQKKTPIEDLTGLQRLALSITLMDYCNFRVGQLKHNKKSTGLLTIETQHYTPENRTIAFIGKKRVPNQCYLYDEKLNGEIQQLWREVDNYHPNKKDKKFLFRFDGGSQRVTTEDLNNFLKIYHPDFSAKMFRTWKANLMFVEELNSMEIPNTLAEIRENLKIATNNVAARLYHTPTICRRSYLDGRIIELYRMQPELFHGGGDAHEMLLGFLKGFC